MGCWNGTCMLTNLPIHHGNRAVIIPVAQDTTTLHIACYHTDFCKFAGFAIRGMYNDYGNLEDIDDTAAAQETLRLFQRWSKTDLCNIQVDKSFPEGQKPDTVENLLYLIERGYMSWGGKAFGFVMIHEKAFDMMVKEMANRKGSRSEKTLKQHTMEELQKSIKKMEKDKKLGWPVFGRLSDHGGMMHWLRDSFHDGYKMDLDWGVKAVQEALFEVYAFSAALDLLRKNLIPQCGAGSQCDEMHLHKMLASFTIRKERDFRHEAMEGCSDDPEEMEYAKNRTKETFFF